MGAGCSYGGRVDGEDAVVSELPRSPARQDDCAGSSSQPSIFEPSLRGCPEKSEDWRTTYEPKFVNGMLKACWSSIEDFSKKIVLEVVEPAMRHAAGSVVGEAFSIDYESYSLGHKPVQFGPMRIGQAVQRTADGREIEIMVIRSWVEWNGAPQIYVSSKFGRIGVSRLTMSGDMLMELVGKSPRPPLFQGARACFINPPELRVEVGGGPWAVSAMNTGVFRVALHKVLAEQFAQRLVAPNRMGVVLDRSCDAFDITKPMPRGMLRLTFVRAHGLKASDINNASDPYIQVTCGAVKMRSEVKSCTCDPVYSWHVLLPIDMPSEQLLQVDLWDCDTLDRDDFLGALHNLRVSDVIRWGTNEEKTLALHDQDGQPGMFGSLTMQSEWRPLVTAECHPEAVLKSPAALIFVGVYTASRLPLVEPDVSFWVEVQCTNRLGLSGMDVTKPRCSPRKKVPEAPAATAAVAQAESRAFERKRTLLHKYSVSREDMAAILEVDADAVDQPPSTCSAARELLFNYAVDMYVDSLGEAELTIRLMRSSPARSTLSGAKAVASTLYNRVSGMGKGAASGTAPGQVCVGEWKRAVRDLLMHGGPTATVLEVPGAPTNLHAQLQVRCLGDPSAEE